jgi:hypothetical protein
MLACKYFCNCKDFVGSVAVLQECEAESVCESRILSESERAPKKKKSSVSFESDTHSQIVKKDGKLRASWNEADQTVM